jgi:DNA adenine methylase
MVLRRLGNKAKIAHKIIAEFPKHTCYVEPFFGAGGMFFNKPKAKYNIVNDLDSDVFNLFQVIMNHKEKLEKAFYIMPIHNDLLAYWKKNKETDPIKKALRFLLLSNFTFLGMPGTLNFSLTDSKKIFYERIDNTFDKLTSVKFNNCDFKDFFDAISFRTPETKKKHLFIATHHI